MTPTARAPGERPRVLVVIGTRPEAVKMAPVVDALRRRGEEVDCRVLLTGQHTTLVQQMLGHFRIAADRDLAVMQEGQTLSLVGARILEGLERVIPEERPSMTLVQGDTASVFFAGLASFFHGIPVGHVEAGLRTGNLHLPFPEELFRRLTDRSSDLLFAPTPRSRAALLAEGLPAESIHLTGNTVVDAVHAIAREGGEVSHPIAADLLSRRGDGPLALLTAHRRESFHGGLDDVFRAVRELIHTHPTLQVLFPVHPNPQVLEPAHRILGELERVHLVAPLDYPDLVRFMAACDLILTDSGGIQEEAPTFGVPVLVLRTVTERPEAVESGDSVLVGTDAEAIVDAATPLLATWPERRELRQGRIATGEPTPSPFGDGRAGERIADLVIHRITGRKRLTQDMK